MAYYVLAVGHYVIISSEKDESGGERERRVMSVSEWPDWGVLARSDWANVKRFFLLALAVWIFFVFHFVCGLLSLSWTVYNTQNRRCATSELCLC